MQRTDARRAALVVAVILTFENLYGFVVPIQMWNMYQRLQWEVFVLLAVGLLLAIPLLVLFWILETTNITPFLSRRLRYLALITACVEGMFLALPQLYRLARIVQQHPQLGWYNQGTVAEQFWRWIKTPWVGTQLAGASRIMTEVVLALFLIALFRQRKVAEVTLEPAWHLARRIAGVTVLIKGMLIVLGVIRISYVIARWFGTQIPIHYVLRSVWAQLPNLCWALVTWIVYRGLAEPPAQSPESVS